MMYFFKASFSCYNSNGSEVWETRYITIDRDTHDLQTQLNKIKNQLEQSYSRVYDPVVENISTPPRNGSNKHFVTIYHKFWQKNTHNFLLQVLFF